MTVVSTPKSKHLPEYTVDIAVEMLDIIMPLHLVVSPDGRITHAGPTFAKLVKGRNVIGESLFDLLEFRRPNGLCRYKEIEQAAGTGMVARLPRYLPDNNLKAVSIPLGKNGGLLLNFSLGAGIHGIVSMLNLKIRDFSPADSAGELLYMKEILSVILGASRDLNNRLDGAKSMAEEQAYTDYLTGLNNRRALLGFISRLQGRKAHGGFAILQIDLDFFKTVNDSYGHAAGDYVLQEVSRILLSETRNADLVARLGGDEFVVVLTEFGTESDLKDVATRIINKVGEPIRFGENTCKVGASIGAVIAGQDDLSDVEYLLSQADKALYSSKEQGRGAYNLYNTCDK